MSSRIAQKNHSKQKTRNHKTACSKNNLDLGSYYESVNQEVHPKPARPVKSDVEDTKIIEHKIDTRISSHKITSKKARQKLTGTLSPRNYEEPKTANIIVNSSFGLGPMDGHKHGSSKKSKSKEKKGGEASKRDVSRNL